ncbi:hypothetical protein DFQ26_000230 [Actinomortierella ambigua]|nr:hypothetical protein DFQ26_000230 [Actinomortierella ambigua]
MASAQPTSSDLQSPCPGSHHALHIPEIVEQFLAYILHPVEELYLPSPMQNEDHYPTQQLRPVHHRRPEKLKQPDLFYEHRSPFWFSLLVCRQWFAIGMRLRSTHAVWCDAPHFHHPQTAPPAGPLGTLQLRLNFSPASSGYAGGTRLSNSISSMLVDVSTPCHARGQESDERVILPCLPSDWGREGESRLRTLRLRDVVSDYPTLCRLLMALCGRKLEALHLGLLTLPARARGLNPMRPLATLGLDDIGKLSSHLTVFTMRWHDMPTMQDLERITTVFPRTRFVRLENPYLTMTAIREYRRSLSLAMPLPSIPEITCGCTSV